MVKQGAKKILIESFSKKKLLKNLKDLCKNLKKRIITN
jgi:hypothetical protein